MLAHRLLMTGGSGSFSPVVPIALTVSPHGGWTQANDPHAIEFGGYLYTGLVNGSSGDIEVEWYEVASGTKGNVVVHVTLQVDNHAAPAVFAWETGGDHKLAMAYSQHNGTTVYFRMSANTLESDPTISGGWQSEQNLAVTIGMGSTKATYCTLLQLLGEAGDPLYLFMRDATSDLSTGALAFTKATDPEGAFWDTLTTLWSIAGKSCYWEIESDGDTRIDVCATDGPPGSGSTVSLWHFWYDGTWRQSDGTSMGSPPFDTSDATLLWDGSGGDGWASDIDPNGGNPVVAFYVAGGTPRIMYGRWSGSAWVNTEIATAGAFPDQSLVAVLDHSDLDLVYNPRLTGSFMELWRFRTNDGGATFSGSQVTSGSVADNIYPATIRQNTGVQRVVWLNGSYTGETTFSLGVMVGR